MAVGYQQFVYRDKLHPLPLCQPAPVNPAAVAEPMTDEEVTHLVDNGLFGVKQAYVACQALADKGEDLTVIKNLFPKEPPKEPNGKEPNGGKKFTTPSAHAPAAKTGTAEK